ncbi:hypothetical protein K432DRAFT_397804 [Lepidopterella palustris CBS 459.81]|uniref:Nephrocystin 3-like N-terminal domain-containing protein n=1 Tax=Lepidopterella palustris CBS 459.81 TaxID=1314670 RepID=A0A8E2JA00_9PEZI|nr:hypothetical protein K432DRAFT_397804 [Lepidopterella palustris CBS 459.81]
MLEHVAVIDDCDTLGQKLDAENGIHKLSQRVPTIVSDFVKDAALLRDRIGNATLELVTDIKKLLQNNKIQKLLGVNKDRQRSEMQSELRELRAIDACKWVLADPKFIKRYNAPDSGQLVILGHIGCGKTVIIVHVIKELIRRNKHKLPRPVICYYYYSNDERGKAVCIYSSHILHLLDQQEGLKVKFDR